ncbi:MAG TPA: lysophospholipid acyltransferase family protein [Gemmatimonadaceae bacterium]
MTTDDDTLSAKGRAAVLLGRVALHALGRTWRISTVHTKGLDRLRSSGEAFIYVLWHGQLLPLLWQHRGEGASVLISEHRDGEMVAQAAESLGYGLIRGSTTRGGGRALIGLVRALQAGKRVAITPDGPKGPPLKFAAGALVAAQRSNSFILPVAVSASRAWHLRSWDRFMIPKPFARVTIAYGTPTKVAASTARAAGEEGIRFEKLMEDTQALTRG